MSKQPHEILEELQEAESKLEDLRHSFLRSMGWEYTCDTAATWLWKKEIDGKHMRLCESAAMSLAEFECPFPDELNNHPS